MNVVITGIGMVTPLGNDPAEILRRIQAGDSAAASPAEFDATGFACPLCAQITGFEPQRYVAEPKLIRLMNRDAQLAVAAARLALEDAGLKSGETYSPEEIGLFGATGIAGLPLREIIPLVRISTGPGGDFDLARFGQAGLKAVSPLLSFKILSNMPLCFVSINENLQGPNAIYSPWEGQGAQAIESGVRAVRSGEARCAVVGACDLKTHELAFATLQQLGLLRAWDESRDLGQSAGLGGPRANLSGPVPGEGAAFLVLEREREALARQAHIYSYLGPFGLRAHGYDVEGGATQTRILKSLGVRDADVLVSSANGDAEQERQETGALTAAGVLAHTTLSPKKHLGDLFAAAGLVQVALAAALANNGAEQVLATCFGYGGTQAAFVLKRRSNTAGDAASYNGGVSS